MKNKLGDLLCSFFYTGHSPVASGTTGTLGPMAIAFGLAAMPGLDFGWTCVWLAVGFTLLGIPMGFWGEKYYGTKDPKPFVLDEVAGYFVTMARFDGRTPEWREILAGFFLFRVFDVLKLPPARQFESLRGGYGIMLDDIAAGVYAWAFLWVLRDYFQW